ncbi:hypothetical protein CY652_10635 [Burkholderia sp. WAC0059]|uniref:phage regulatory protein/antirepressor Ant n=1 Tax=Burkholderia sp. WAC0059 TaxID=2066022 RepID=UPI000C7F7470|nr:phage regulatory protein/antirepressor Ant [Burkholderia sp. WAC0059]PLZ02559.1 hypothetical protein CY652_10635 [Burkholderia sp. WAC0059]
MVEQACRAVSRHGHGIRLDMLANCSELAGDALVSVRGDILIVSTLAVARVFDRNHRDVLRTIDGLLADGTLNARNVARVDYVDAKGEKRRMFELDERAAWIAAPFIGGRESRAAQVRLVDAFLALRGQRDESPQHAALPSPSPELMQTMIELAKSNAQLASAVQAQAQKAEAFDQFAAADGSMSMTQAAKSLGIAPHTLIDWLQRNAWIYRPNGKRLAAYEIKIMDGLLVHCTYMAELRDGSRRLVSNVHVTARGLTVLAAHVAAGAIPTRQGLGR